MSAVVVFRRLCRQLWLCVLLSCIIKEYVLFDISSRCKLAIACRITAVEVCSVRDVNPASGTAVGIVSTPTVGSTWVDPWPPIYQNALKMVQAAPR